MKVIIARLWNEPVYLGSVLTAAVALAAGFGFGAGGETVALVTTLITVVTGATARQLVSPTEKHRDRLRPVDRAGRPLG